MVGQQIGKLLVKSGPISQTRKNRSRLYYECQCSCGNQSLVLSSDLHTGRSTSCGCQRQQAKNELGKVYGYLTVIERAAAGSHGNTVKWKCICKCGRITVASGGNLRYGHTRSCGCLIDESPLTRGLKANKIRRSNKTRMNRAYYRWKLEVCKKSNHQCDICKSNENLHAHHLESYSSNPELRVDIDNGICLCSIHHRSFHKKYGKTCNTRQQYLEFKEHQ